MERGIETRRATIADCEAMLATMEAGFETYREFAPSGWEPPPRGEGLPPMLKRFAAPGTWAMLALDDSRPVGHVSFYPGQERRIGEPAETFESRPPVPGLAHLWQLFVLPSHWGTGLAATLHERAVEELRARGYERARLFTPSGQARARAFYERRGWRSGESGYEEPLGLEIVEYRLKL